MEKIMTNDQKIQAIGNSLDIKAKIRPNPLKDPMIDGFEFHYPDFFTPEGQAVLAGALFLADNIETYKRFDKWLDIHEPISSNAIWIAIIEETKLAELFYEFMEGEKECNCLCHYQTGDFEKKHCLPCCDKINFKNEKGEQTR